MDDLSGLIERVEKATGPDHKLDGDIAVALGLFTPSPEFRRGQGLYADRWYSVSTGPYVEFEAPHVTASVDAALALIERVLPGTMWRVGLDPDDGSMKAELVTAAPACVRAAENHDTPALALCLALLRALQGTAGLSGELARYGENRNEPNDLTPQSQREGEG